jgi:hypothetical protein
MQDSARRVTKLSSGLSSERALALFTRESF